MSVVCEVCNATVSSKYILKTHMSTNKACLSLRNLELQSRFKCRGCDTYFKDNQKLVIHKDGCKTYQALILTEELSEKYEKEKKELIENCEKEKIELVETYEKENRDLVEKYEKEKKELVEKYEKEKTELVCTYEHTIKEHKNTVKQHERVIMDTKFTTDKIIRDLQAQNDKLIDSLRQLASQAIEKPSTSTTNVTNHNTIRNHFSEKYFLDAITPEDVKKKCQNYLTEEVFFQGQRGIAQLCTDHIIRTKDQKALMICTDASRKKFKYMDEQGNLKEDHEARAFTEKVSKPIKDVSKILYENILSDVKYEKENVDDEDYSRKSVLSNKEMKAIDCFVQITYFDHPDHNTEYKNELAIRSAFAKSGVPPPRDGV